ncbi:hypothetical protein [Oceanicaulis alexandrii]|uniref:hypothetical protein n=1 Tax=Oceanicaulis alexandrii TaxID=153233 RepID=UPI003B5092D6
MQRNIAWEGKSQSEREATTAFNLNLSGEENARNAGIVATGAGQQRETEYAERKRREERFRDVLLQQQLSPEAQAALGALGDYGDRLRDEQRRIERRMAELRERGEARDTISELIATGALDRDNAEHLALLDRAGLDPDQSDDELRNTIDRDAAQDGEEYDALATRHAEIERQLPLVEAARERIENGDDPEAVLRDLADQGIEIEVEGLERDNVFEQVAMRARDLEDERDALSPAVETEFTAAESVPGAEQEVSEFMQTLAARQVLMMGEAALADAMQEQIDGLSDEAREQLEATEETAFLFEQSEAQPAAPAQDATAPTEDQRPDQSPGITPGSNL